MRYNSITIYRLTLYRVTKELRRHMSVETALTETTYYILLSLYSPRHGYGIIQETERLSGGRIRLAAGTLYGALNSMCDKGWILLLPVEDGSRKKEYKITQRGLEVLQGELARLRELVENGDKVMGGKDNG